MPADEPRSEPARTSLVPALREQHLDEVELVEFSNDLLDPEQRRGVLQHLDACPRCREVLAAMHREDDGGVTRLSDPLIGCILGEYRVERALSRGGMGAVYRGVQPVIGKKVAIKVLLPDVADEAETSHRLLEEARAVNAVRHPNIIDIFSFGTLPDGRHYFVMELLDGRPLDELLGEKGRLSPSEVITVLDQAMAALGAAHAAGVIHRDLKPANLFVTTLPNHSWHLTVLDFGLAKRLGASSSTSPNVVMGTPGYMAPEQIRGQKVTAATDLYAMGVVAWVLLTGDEPFHADSFVDLMLKHLEAPLPRLRALAPDCPASLARLVEQFLEKKPEARPRSALEVQEALSRIRRELDGKDTLKVAGLVTPLAELRKPASAQETRAMPVEPEGATAPGAGAVETRVVQRDGPTAGAKQAAAPALPPAPRGLARAVLAAGALALIVLAALVWRWAEGHQSSGLVVDVVAPGDVSSPPGGDTAPTPGAPSDTDTAPTPGAPSDTDAAPTPGAPPLDEGGPSAPETPAGGGSRPVADTPSTTPKAGAGVPKPPKQKVGLRARLERARVRAAQLPSAAARRMMSLELDRVEARLEHGEDARAVGRELDDILQNYEAP